MWPPPTKLFAILGVVFAITSVFGTTHASSTVFEESFDDASIVEPTPFVSPRWDVVVHSRDRGTWRQLEAMDAEHGPDCGAPPATHQLDGRYEDAVFQCRNHLMTAIKAGGYGVIYLTPNQLADFSAGEAVIKFDVSTLRSSNRDWWDLWITPYDENLVAPFDMGDVDLQGLPKRGIHVRMDSFNGKTAFRVKRIENFVEADLGSCWSCGYEDKLTPSSVRRDTFELRISRTHVKFWMPQYGITWLDKELATPLDWDSGVVQIGHHSYTPTKDCTPSSTRSCTANTWHWDNVSISPARPFTVIRANDRAAFEGARGQPLPLTFAEPAPEGAFLRVQAYGLGYEVSTDDGASWETLRRQPSGRDSNGHAKPYWHPIPAGTTQVLLRTTVPGWWGLGGVDYAAIWAPAVSDSL